MSEEPVPPKKRHRQPTQVDRLFVELHEKFEKYMADVLAQQQEIAEATWVKAASEKERADSERRRRVAEERRAAAVEQLLADVGLVITEDSQLNKLVLSLLTQLPLSSAVLELVRETQRGYDRLYAIQRLILQALQTVIAHVDIGDEEEQVAMAKRLNALVVNQETLESLEEQMRRLVQRRNLIREQIALYGHDNAPPEKIIEDERLTEQIEELGEQLREYAENGFKS